MKLLKGLWPALVIFPLLAACNEATENQSAPGGQGTRAVAELVVYKSPSCGCCKQWISHIEREGIATSIQHPADLNAIKDRYRIAPAQQSCHTAVSSQGYVFEGHVPARYIREFLANPPRDAIGLAVPGMPVGSPGMEVGDSFMPYQILLLKKDGSSEVFASVVSADEQYQREAQP